MTFTVLFMLWSLDPKLPRMHVNSQTKSPTNRVRIGIAVIGIVAMLFGAVLTLRHKDADALASCIPHTNTPDEMTFLAQLQGWRDANIPGSYPLTLSSPLNAAAAGYARYLVDHPGSAGHFADGGNWASRAVQCGYPSGEAAGGEGLAVVQASGMVSVSPAQALQIMTSEQGGGVHVPSNVGAPVKCVGVARVSAADGHEDAWVTLLFAAFNSCAEPVTGPPPGSATNTPTVTPTMTPTPTPTATPNYNTQITLLTGWNLVTLPPGPLSDILDTARQCFSAVYQADADHWLRYVPGAPAYTNNLSVSNGGAFWILGTDANCGVVRI